MARASRLNSRLGTVDAGLRFVTPALRQRNLPGIFDPPPMASMPTYTAGAANAATTISGSILFQDGDRGAFTYFGGRAAKAVNTNMFTGINPNGILLSTPPPWAAEFTSDTAQMEIRYQGAGGSGRYRLLRDGQLCTTAAIPFKSDTNTYLDLYDFGTRDGKMHLYRLEFEGTFRFGGIRVPATATVTRTPDEPATVIVGDSFTEPTIRDQSAPLFAHDGYVSRFGRALGLRNAIPSGSGGTGYINPATSPKVKFRDRFLNDVVPLNPARVFFAGGINDGNREGSNPSITAQMVHDEAVQLFTLAKQQLPYAEIGVFGPWSGKSGPSSSMFAVAEAIRVAATECGLPFYDLYGMQPEAARISTTLTAATGNYTSSFVAAAPLPVGSKVRVGSPTAWGTTPNWVNIGEVSAVSGSGPYTHNLYTGLGNPTPFPVGTQVVTTGYPWCWGTGMQGSPANLGPSDWAISDDSTHPTPAGHLLAARSAFAKYVSTLPY